MGGVASQPERKGIALVASRVGRRPETLRGSAKKHQQGDNNDRKDAHQTTTMR